MTETLRSRIPPEGVSKKAQELAEKLYNKLCRRGQTIPSQECEEIIEQCLMEVWNEAIASTKPKKPHCPKCNSDDVGLIFDPPSVVNREEDIYQCLKCKYESKDWNEWSPR